MSDILSLKDNRDLIVQEMSTKASQTSVNSAITKIDSANTTLASIKAKTDTITNDLFTSTHASRIDANISTRALETTAQAIKAKTDLITSAAMSSGVVKSIQRYNIGNFNNTKTSIATTLQTPVNSNKTIVLMNVGFGSNSTTTLFPNIGYSLTNTILTTTIATNGTYGDIFCFAQVIEFY